MAAANVRPAADVARAKLFNRAARKMLTTENTAVVIVDYAEGSKHQALQNT